MKKVAIDITEALIAKISFRFTLWSSRYPEASPTWIYRAVSERFLNQLKDSILRKKLSKLLFNEQFRYRVLSSRIVPNPFVCAEGRKPQESAVLSRNDALNRVFLNQDQLGESRTAQEMH
jgi:hypothetical protein